CSDRRSSLPTSSSHAGFGRLSRVGENRHDRASQPSRSNDVKHKFSGISAIAVAALMLTATGAALPAFADGDHRARMVEMIERLDTNQDGQIDRDEFMAARDEKFVALDGDGDGS